MKLPIYICIDFLAKGKIIVIYNDKKKKKMNKRLHVSTEGLNEQCRNVA